MGGGIPTLLPHDGDIHRVGNPADRPAISLHLHGPLGRIDGRDYDPRRDMSATVARSGELETYPLV